MIEQQGDVLLYQTVDGGDINIANGLVEMSGGLETAAYLSLFGANEEDDGRGNNQYQWWGNLIENTNPRKYRSETQFLLKSIPASSGNLRRIEDSNTRDLQWMIDEKIATEIVASVSIPSVNKIDDKISINAVGQESNFNYLENWKVEV